MNVKHKSWLPVGAAVAVAITLGIMPVPHAQAAEVQITVENLAPSGGLFLTPLWFGIHDGTFDTFTVGQTATAVNANIIPLAEGGDTGPLSTSFAANGGVDGVIAPGSPFGPVGSAFAGSASSIVSVADPVSYRYFSFASMVIPSNDAFIGNDNPTAYELFDAAGNFTGPLTITVFGSQIWDAGSEVNDINGGAAFSALGGTSVDEDLPVVSHLNGAVNPGLDAFLGTGFGPAPVAGETLTAAFGSFTPIARITITPEPTSGLLFAAVAGLWGLRRRRIMRA